MPKAKVILKEKKLDENGLTYIVKEKGDIGMCLTMALRYVANIIVDQDTSTKEVTQLLKQMIKEETDRRGEGTWL